MKKKQFVKSLTKISTLLKQRKLEKAVKQGLLAFEKASRSQDRIAISQIHILLAKIYNQLGFYQEDEVYFEKTIDLLNIFLKDDAFDDNPVYVFQILLQLSIAYRGKHNNELADEMQTKAKKISENIQYLEGIVLSNIELCKKAIEENSFAKATALVEESIVLITNVNNPAIYALQADLYNLLGRIQIRRQDIVETLKISKVALEISRANEDVENELVALNNLAIVHGIKSEYKEAMEYLNSALTISQQINYHKQTARCKINMGSIYAHLFNYSGALQQYKSVLEGYRDSIEASTEIVLLNNIGNIYFDQRKVEEAEIYFTKAQQMAKATKYLEMEAITLVQLARCSRVNNLLDEGLRQANKAQELLEKTGSVNGTQLNLINIGLIYQKKGNLAQSSRFLSKGVVKAKTLQDDISQIRAYEALSKVYHEMGNLEQAYTYAQITNRYQAEYAQIQRNRQILDLEIKYRLQERQQEIERLQVENNYQALLLEQKDKIELQNEQLIEVNHELKRFASVVSHDLKEPLRMIGSFAKIIHKQHHAYFDERTNEYFGYVTDGVSRMDKLLRALMYYATIGGEEEPTQRIDLNELIGICCLHLRQPIHEGQAQVVYEGLPIVYSKNSLLIQLFQNLISNAIKFRTKERTPVIHILGTEENEHIKITVKDNGIGIPKKAQKKIFEIFRRLNRPDAYEGTGVGLAVCQKIVKRLGGEINVESVEGEGTSFIVNLPIGKA